MDGKTLDPTYPSPIQHVKRTFVVIYSHLFDGDFLECYFNSGIARSIANVGNDVVFLVLLLYFQMNIRQLVFH